MEYIEQQILPEYQQFDAAHQLPHVSQVIKNSLELAKKLGADIDMAYAVAAYHDLGLRGPRAVHHLESGKILAADKRLTKWFSPAQIRIMKEAVEDHRASAAKAPRNIYGKIVAEADRNLEPETVMRRTVQFGLANYPGINRQQQFLRFKEHLQDKYSQSGYIKLWIPGSKNEESLKHLREIISNANKVEEAFNRLFDEENQQTSPSESGISATQVKKNQ